MQSDILEPSAPMDEDLLETLNIVSLEIPLLVDLRPIFLYAWKKNL